MDDDNKIIVADSYLNPVRWEQMTKLATSLVQSGAFPKAIKNAPQALIVMQAGIEMGMKPLEAINSLSIINGVVNTWGKATVNRLREHGWRIKYEMLNERGGGCRATVTKADEEYTDVLYFDQAEKSKWTQMKLDNGAYVLKPGWYEGANREMKLRYGVLSKIIKTYIPDVLGSAQDIAEVAEDYVVEEVKEPEKPVEGKAEVMQTTMDERKKSLADFINNEKTKESGQKFPKSVKKEEKPIETTSIPPKNVEDSKVTADDKAGAIDGEVIETSESKETKE